MASFWRSNKGAFEEKNVKAGNTQQSIAESNLV